MGEHTARLKAWREQPLAIGDHVFGLGVVLIFLGLTCITAYFVSRVSV